MQLMNLSITRVFKRYFHIADTSEFYNPLILDFWNVFLSFSLILLAIVERRTESHYSARLVFCPAKKKKSQLEIAPLIG